MSEYTRVWRLICTVHGYDEMDDPRDHALTGSEIAMLIEAWELDVERYYERERASEYASYMC